MKLVRRIVGKISHIILEMLAKLSCSRGYILMLHWISDEQMPGEYEPYRISVENFKEFVLWLKTKKVIHLLDWERSEDFYSLTIDDVPESFYTNAFPILKDEGIPFTLFVNLSLLDKAGYISKDQLLEMSMCELCTIGSHGVYHSEYAVLNDKQALEELSESRRLLEKIVEKPVDLFAFPYGSYYACGFSNKHLVSDIYKYGFSTVSSPITRPQIFKNYFLPRINVSRKFLNNIICQLNSQL